MLSGPLLGILESTAPANLRRPEERSFVESMMSLGAFIAMMAILFAVPEPAKRLSAKADVTELRPAA
jgi:hypothetical protein